MRLRADKYRQLALTVAFLFAGAVSMGISPFGFWGEKTLPVEKLGAGTIENIKEWSWELGFSPPIPKEEVEEQVEAIREELGPDQFGKAKFLLTHGTE